MSIRSTFTQPWILSPRLLGIFLLVLVVYAVVAELFEFDLLGMKAPDESASKHRLGECAVIWVLLCMAAGWVQFARGKRPAWTARLWPVLVVPALATLWFVISAIVSLPGQFTGPPSGPPDPWYWFNVVYSAMAIGGPLVVFAGCVIVFWTQARVWRLPSAAICVGCGYDLHGNASGVCPECGMGVVTDATIPTEFYRRHYRWTPELAEFPDATTRAQAWRQAVAKASRSPCYIVWLLACILCFSAAHPWTARLFGPWRWAAMLASVMMSLSFVVTMHQKARKNLRRQLEERRAS